MTILNRVADKLGYVPGLYRHLPATKKRRVRMNPNPIRTRDEGDGAEFFGTSCYDAEANDQARKKEVSRLFARMRSELMEIAQDFADDAAGALPPHEQQVRKGLFIEMVVASEFVVDELDAEIASLCLKGSSAAESAGGQALVAEISQLATTLSKARTRISDFQQELDSMLAIRQESFCRRTLDASLNFDPLTHDRSDDGKAFIEHFLQSIDESIAKLSEFVTIALRDRDFETASLLCACILQLANFLSDTNKLIV